MLKSVKDACEPHPKVFETSMGDQIEDLATVIADLTGATAFFARNYVTAGMQQLFEQGLGRLAGNADQAVFELAQAMGGGKTHTMIALGLLARHDSLRRAVVPELARRAEFSGAKVVSFSGRNYPDHFLWGEIAHQLGKAAEFAKYWQNGPSAPDEVAWIRLIGDEPTLILLDELPPYFDYAITKAVGGGTLANVATAALANLLAAVLKLKRTCIVISNLSGSYEGASSLLRTAMRNFEQETRRQAKPITPVSLGGDEIYQILRKRLFTRLPSADDIDTVAQAFAQKITEAEKSKTIGKSGEQIAHEIRSSYPFHPVLKDLIALFRDNESFRQTRGLMQFVARMIRSAWARPTNDVYLVGLQHLNLRDADTREEIIRIRDLRNAISMDVAGSGDAHAEIIDANLNEDAGSQVAALMLATSLSSAPDAVRGMNRQRLLECVVAPNRETLQFAQAFDHLRQAAWYLHRDERNDFWFFSNNENLTKRLASEAERAPLNKIEAEMRRRLEEIFEPAKKAAYQELKALPTLDEVKLSGGRVLVVLSPDAKNPPDDAKRFHDAITEKNNVCFLTGDGSDMSSLEQKTRYLWAIVKVKRELPEAAPQQAELDEKLELAEHDFNSAVISLFNRVWFPTKNGLTYAKLAMTFTANEFNGEEQVEKALADPGAGKLVLDVEKDAPGLIQKAEDLLWPQNVKRLPWRDLRAKAITIPRWTWLPNNGLDDLRQHAERRGIWRSTEDGIVERGPFEKPRTRVDVQVRHYEEETGKATLEVIALDAGPAPQIFHSETPDVTPMSSPLKGAKLETNATRLFFLAVDPRREHETGEPFPWTNQLTITHQPREGVGGRRTLELKVVPRGAIKYTLDGANAAEGSLYKSPFEIAGEEVTVYCHAEDQGVTAKRNFTLPKAGHSGIRVDETRPAKLRKRLQMQNTAESFGLLGKAKEMKATMFDTKLEIGTGGKTASLRFGAELALGADMLESIIKAIRTALGDEMADVRLGSGSIQFATGKDLSDFVSGRALTVAPNEVEQ